MDLGKNTNSLKNCFEKETIGLTNNSFKLSKQEKVLIQKEKEITNFMEDLETYYFDSFVFKEDFQNKRFGRYVEKVKSFVFEKLKAHYIEFSKDYNLESCIGKILIKKYIYDFFEVLEKQIQSEKELFSIKGKDLEKEDILLSDLSIELEIDEKTLLSLFTRNKNKSS